MEQRPNAIDSSPDEKRALASLPFRVGRRPSKDEQDEALAFVISLILEIADAEPSDLTPTIYAGGTALAVPATVAMGAA